MAKRDNGNYREEKAMMAEISGAMAGLNSLMQKSPITPLQQGRIYPGGTIDAKDLGSCCINSTHCYRTVSQRSLSVPTRFVGVQNGAPPNIPAGVDIFNRLFSDTGGSIALQPGQTELFFNNANTQSQRARVYDLVLIAVRSEVQVMLLDGEPVAVGSIDVSNFQAQVEKLANMLLQLKVYHAADRADPWIDKTNIGYFSRPSGQYQLVPPVMWIDRDPVMSIQVAEPEFIGGLQNLNNAYDGMTSNVRDLEGVANITIECLFVPDPYTCPDLWPGQLCPRDMIANTPDYKGKIASAVRRITGS